MFIHIYIYIYIYIYLCQGSRGIDRVTSFEAQVLRSRNTKTRAPLGLRRWSGVHGTRWHHIHRTHDWSYFTNGIMIVTFLEWQYMYIYMYIYVYIYSWGSTQLEPVGSGPAGRAQVLCDPQEKCSPQKMAENLVDGGDSTRIFGGFRNGGVQSLAMWFLRGIGSSYILPSCNLR